MCSKIKGHLKIKGHEFRNEGAFKNKGALVCISMLVSILSRQNRIPIGKGLLGDRKSRLIRAVKKKLKKSSNDLLLSYKESTLRLAVFDHSQFFNSS